MVSINFTFGIVTNAENGVNEYLPKVVESIYNQKIPGFDIIIVGNKRNIENHFKDDKLKIIDFNENIKTAWITRKKNLITQESIYENIVYLHDYIAFDDGWYDGWLQYGDDWQACMNRIKNVDGSRYRDWVLWPMNNPIVAQLGLDKRCLLPYEETRLSKHQYFSGAYWVAKKSCMLNFPLDERLVWGGGEDVNWSVRYRSAHDFSMNKFSSVTMLKHHGRVFDEISEKELNEFLIKAGVK